MPIPTIEAVLIILRISFWAVPAFKRVDPVNTSGPTTTSILFFAIFPISEPTLHEIEAVLHPIELAYCKPDE